MVEPTTTVKLYRYQIAGDHKPLHSLSAQIPASHLMGLDLGLVGDRFQRLRRLIAQWEIISRHRSDVDALSPNILAWPAARGPPSREASVCPQASRSTLTLGPYLEEPGTGGPECGREFDRRVALDKAV